MRKFGFIGDWIRSLLVGPVCVALLIFGCCLILVWIVRKRTGKNVRWPVSWGILWTAIFLSLCLPYPSVLLDLPLEAWGKAVERRFPVPDQLSADDMRSTVVFVLGGGVTDSGFVSNVSLDRIECGYRVWKRMPQAWFMFSDGGLGIHHTADRLREYLERTGIPKDRILLETDAMTTQQNVLFGREIMKKHGIERVILVTTRRHLPRALAVCQRYGLEVAGVAGAYAPPSLEFCPAWRHLSRFSAVLNEYVGFLGYKVLGWA